MITRKYKWLGHELVLNTEPGTTMSLNDHDLVCDTCSVPYVIYKCVCLMADHNIETLVIGGQTIEVVR